LADGSRTITFFYNGTQVHQVTGFTLLPNPFRAFLYGWSGSVSFDYLTVSPDDTYDGFYGSSLSPRWTPTLLAGSSSGSYSVSNQTLTINGGSNSRYGMLSNYLPNSAIDWTTVSTRLLSDTGTNALMDIYGGSGTGDFSHFVEFGVEGGVAKVYTASGIGNWVGSAVTLPATLDIKVSPYYSSGRRFKFFVNGSQVDEISASTDVPAPDFRVFLYGWSTSTSGWNYVNISQRHMWDPFAPHFEGGPGLSVDWTPTSLAGGWGSASQGNSELTINGASNSRYGIVSAPLGESDIYGYTVESKLDAVTGTNGLMDIYAGTGRGDFTHFIEFGVEGGVLKVFGDGITTWVGGAATLPAVLRVEVSAWTASGRNLYFFYNNQLVDWLEGVSTIPNAEYAVFLYGWGTSVTKWDYLTWWKQGEWNEDGYADRATYLHDRTASNGSYSEQVAISQHTTGRKGISQYGLAVTSGHAYQVSAYLKQSGLSAPVTVYLGPGIGDGPSYSTYASTTISSVATAWTKYTVTLTPGATDQQAKLFIGAGGTGSLWIDGVSLMPQDPSEVAYGGWRKDFIDKLTALNPTAIRWPGGIIADWWHWQDSVGAQDSRVPMYYGQWDAEWLTNDVGVHEILNLAESLGLTPVLNVNWGTGSSTEAANWVEYTNGSTSTTYGAMRQANGRTNPWSIKNWEIGNEVWGPWTPGWTSSASTFANSYVAFHDAMAAKDSTLNYIGEGGDGNGTDQTWNQTMIQTAGTRLDHLATHFYPPQGLPQNYDSSALYLTSVGAPATLSGRLDTDQSTILNNTTQDVKMAITEYNAMYFNEEHRRTRTLEAALQLAGQINLFARRDDLIELNFVSALVNFWDGSAIRLGNRGTLVTPGEEVMRLFSNYHGPVLVRADVSSDTYNATAIGNLPARSGIPYLDATVTKSLNGGNIYLSVINRDPTNARATPITISNGGTIGSTATAYTLNSNGYLDTNTWQNPTLIAAATSTITGVSSSFTYTFPAHSYTVLVLTASAASITVPAVAGHVVDTTNNPISGATVQVTGGNSGTTDSDGYFLIPVSSAGAYTLTASATGHTTVTHYHVRVQTTGSTALAFQLG
jgi:alpha-L-arabinofuranosidase